MAPSSGHILVPKVMNAFKYAVSRTAQAVRSRIAQSQGAGTASIQPVAIPLRTSRQPVHPIAALRQSQRQATRSFSTSVRNALVETYPSLRQAASRKAALPVSRTSTLISRTPSASTFASTLRPNLTGGTLQRTAGGYGNIGGKRMFSHVSSGAHAQVVVQNVSAGVRAFWLGGQRAQFDGVDARTGEKRFVATGKSADRAARKMAAAGFCDDARGTTLEFSTVPELNAFSQERRQAKKDLPSVVGPLATDFARSLGALAAVHRDLKRLSSLGDLPVSEPRPGVVAVRFPGCDGQTVESLCDELGVYRGLVREDEGWAEEQAQDVKMALLFPTAPSDHADMEEYDAAAYFYETPYPSPQRALGLESDRSYTADETLSPLDSIQGSHVHSFEHLSAPRSVVSWQPNPWIDESSGEATTTSGSAKRRSPPGGGGEGIQEVDSIFQFIAQCEGRVRP